MDVEMAWAIGLFEGEGCITLNRSNGTSVRSGEQREYVNLVLSMTDEDVVRRFHKIVGFGSISFFDPKIENRKRQWRWNSGARQDVYDFLKLIKPYLGKRRKARATEAIRSIEKRLRFYDQ